MLFKNFLVVATTLAASSVAAPVSVSVEERAAEPANVYGIAHTLKMADDAFKKREPKPQNAYGIAHTLKMADDAFKKREPEPGNAYGIAHTLKMADDAFKA